VGLRQLLISPRSPWQNPSVALDDLMERVDIRSPVK